MRWPWSNGTELRADVGTPQETTPTVSPAGWAVLPPLQRHLGSIETTSGLTSFPGQLAAWRSPGLVGPVQRQVSPRIRARVVPDRPTSPGGDGRVASPLPVVARLADRSATSSVRYAVPGRASTASSSSGSTSSDPAPPSPLVSSTDAGLPVIELVAEPSPESDPDQVALGTGESPGLQRSTSGPEPRAPMTHGPADVAALHQWPLTIAGPRSASGSYTIVDLPVPEAAAPAPSDPGSSGDDRPSAPASTTLPAGPASVQRHAAAVSPGSRPRIGLGAPLPSRTDVAREPVTMPVAQRAADLPSVPDRPQAAKPAPGLGGLGGLGDLGRPGGLEPGSAVTAPRSPAAAPPEGEPTADAGHDDRLVPTLGPLERARSEMVLPKQPHAAEPQSLTVSRAVGDAPTDPVEADSGQPSGETTSWSDADVVTPDVKPAPVQSMPTVARTATASDVSLPSAATDSDPVSSGVHSSDEPWAGSESGGSPYAASPERGPTSVEGSPAPFRSGPAPAGADPSPGADPAPRAWSAPPAPPLPVQRQSTTMTAISPSRVDVARSPGALGPLVVQRSLPSARLAPLSGPTSFPVGSPGPSRIGPQQLMSPDQTSDGSSESPQQLQRFPGLAGLPTDVPSRPRPPRIPASLAQSMSSADRRAIASAVPMPVAVTRAFSQPVPDVSAPDVGSLASEAGSAVPRVPSEASAGTTTEHTGIPDQASASSDAGSPRSGATAAPPGGASAGQGAQSPQQLDELARRLYDPIAARLKAELLLDRERRGCRTDSW